jgi:hypothetical protein
LQKVLLDATSLYCNQELQIAMTLTTAMA